jgi:hypothetical protein
MKISNKEDYKIKLDISGESGIPSEELLLRMKAAFEANDVETLESLEKEWFREK